MSMDPADLEQRLRAYYHHLASTPAARPPTGLRNATLARMQNAANEAKEEHPVAASRPPTQQAQPAAPSVSTRRHRMLLPSLATVAIVLSLVVLLVALRHPPTEPGPSLPYTASVPTVCPGGEQGPPNGIAAIPPRSHCLPSFTVQDVLTYLTHHDAFAATKYLTVVGHPTLTRILFLRNSDLGGVTGGETLGLAGSAIVCYVEFQGTFILPLPPEAPRTVHLAYLVYDGYSGNLLAIGP